jgi:hypothetical protein
LSEGLGWDYGEGGQHNGGGNSRDRLSGETWALHFPETSTIHFPETS